MSDHEDQREGDGTQLVSIIHPVHDGANIHGPFIHALRLALAAQGELEIVDVRDEEEMAAEQLSVRTVLERWRLLPEGSHRSDVAQVGLRVKKIVLEGNKRKEIVKRIRRHHHDILVIGTRSHSGMGAIFSQGLEAYLADRFHQTTLFIPSGAQGFVSEQTGFVTLKTILLPLDSGDECRASFDALRRFLSFFKCTSPSIIGIHSGHSFPVVPNDLKEKIDFREDLSNEPVVPAILSAASKYDADLIVMATHGRDSISQKIVGSKTEQVVHSTPCPVLSAAR